MTEDAADVGDIDKWDPGLTQRVMGVMRPVLKTYFRCQVHGLGSFPPGGALVVGNHSGGTFPMDVPIFSAEFSARFGFDRPVYTLSHDILMAGPTGQFFRRTGYIRANRENAAAALRSGGVVIVFPGGDYDAYRPTLSESVIDFNGRKGYVRTAVEAGVPIVPAVSIGGQETRLYLSRGTWLAERLGVKRLLRSAILPLSFGFPFGLSAVIPPNVPLAHQDRDAGAGADRHRSALRRRTRRRRGRRVRALGHAAGSRRAGRRAPLPGPGRSRGLSHRPGPGPVVTRRKFDLEATLELVDRHRATGLAVVPVMFDRIMELPAEVRNRYSGKSVRFAAASGSRMCPDVSYHNYNATEAGMIATATAQDLRAAPDTAGRPAGGTEIRILDHEFHERPPGEVDTIYVRNDTQFEGYTEGSTKDFQAGFVSSGDVGYLDAAGRLIVVGRYDEMIVSGGENVYPVEVEKTLAAHPGVAEAR